MKGWKIGLGVALILIILITLILFFRPARQIIVYSVPLCNVRVEKAVETLVKKDFRGSWNNFFTPMVAGVMAVNNMRCGSEVYTANFAIILEDGSKILFGIFHVRFSHEGKFIYSTPAVLWRQYPDRNDPRIDATWKNFTKFIQKVYPEKTKKPD